MTDQAVAIRADDGPEKNERHCDRDRDYDCDCNSECDFSFAFDNGVFSDRVLTIEVMPDPDPVFIRTECLSLPTIVNLAPNSKRRRKHTAANSGVCVRSHKALYTVLLKYLDRVPFVPGANGEGLVARGKIDVCELCARELMIAFCADDVLLHNEDQVNCNLLDAEEAVAMIEGSSSGDDVSDGNDISLGMSSSGVRTIHISSAILAAKSPFFYKLFSNGMRESEQQNVTLRIHASEEAAFLDLLNFMYTNTLSRTTSAAVLDVLMAADKFEVASCIKHCSRMLRRMPMTCETALIYLDLPSSILMSDAIQPLIEAAKLFLAKHYRDLTKFADEVLNLPLAGIEAVLSSDDLQMPSEDAVYDFVLEWARRHYPKIEDRQEVLGLRLGQHIRFPYMTCRKLKKVLKCKDFHPDYSTKFVFEAMFFKAETPHRRRLLAAQDERAACHRFVERAYKYRPVKAVEFALPHPRCIAYFDLKKEDCANLFPSGRIYSQAFLLGGQGFFLSAHCCVDQQNPSSHCFGLFLGMQDKGSVSFKVDYEFAARSKPNEEYISRYRGNYNFTGGKIVGYRNLFGMNWTAFTADDCHYFINGLLHIRAELSLKQ